MFIYTYEFLNLLFINLMFELTHWTAHIVVNAMMKYMTIWMILTMLQIRFLLKIMFLLLFIWLDTVSDNMRYVWIFVYVYQFVSKMNWSTHQLATWIMQWKNNCIKSDDIINLEHFKIYLIIQKRWTLDV